MLYITDEKRRLPIPIDDEKRWNCSLTKLSDNHLRCPHTESRSWTGAGSCSSCLLQLLLSVCGIQCISVFTKICLPARLPASRKTSLRGHPYIYSYRHQKTAMHYLCETYLQVNRCINPLLPEFFLS